MKITFNRLGSHWGLISIGLFLMWLIPTGILIYSFLVEPLDQNLGIFCLGVSIVSFVILTFLAEKVFSK